MQEKPAVREVYNLFDSLTDVDSAAPSEPKGDSAVDASDELAAACAEANTKTPNSQNNQNSQRQLRQVIPNYF